MIRPRMRMIVLALAAAAGLGACGRQMTRLLGPNVRPEIEILDARAGAAGAELRVTWAARDPDGRVDHYEWAVSEPGRLVGAGDWTTCLDARLAHRLAAAGAAIPSREPRIFSVRAVDAGGAKSDAATIGYFAGNVAPTVQITCPVPSALIKAQLPPSLTITWTGNDPDGVYFQHPYKYKYKMLYSFSEVTVQTAIANPDSVRRYYAPLAWAGWDSTSGDTTTVRFTNLIPGMDYVFVVVGFDEQGDYSLPFSLNGNMLQMRIVNPGTQGPVLAMASSGLYYSYASGAWSTDPARIVRTEVAAGAPVNFNWSATPAAGQTIAGYRWVLDPVDLFDTSPRSNEATDVGHWSQWNATTTSCLLGPFNPPGVKRELHTLYIDVADSAGCGEPLAANRSLGIIQFAVVHPTFRKSLLIVDDTRLLADRILTGQTCTANPSGSWPTSAELDTFLYAAGGMPWKCYPAGTLSAPGLFAGYAYDTLGTRGYNGGNVPLAILADYQYVIWYTDATSATYTAAPTAAFNPTTTMRYMSAIGRSNVLAAYAKMGGRLWIAGGGAAAASLYPHDKSANNTGRTVFSSAPQYNELGPGRFMYSAAHVQSELSLGTASRFDRALGRFASSPGSYATLPLALTAKTAGTDPLPPLRTSSLFYQTSFGVEFVSQPNAIAEGDPAASTLDTLFSATVSGLGAGRIAAIAYHGADNGPVLFTGFDFWHFQRTQCIQLVDWVLQTLWGLPRDPVTRAPQSAALPVADPGARGANRLAPQVHARANPLAPATPRALAIRRSAP